MGEPLIREIEHVAIDNLTGSIMCCWLVLITG